MIRINNITPRVYGTFGFKRKEEGYKKEPRAAAQENIQNAPRNTGALLKYSAYGQNIKIAKSTSADIASMDMPPDVFLIYRMAKKLSKDITKEMPNIQSGFAKADAIMVFSREGNTVQIFNSKTRENFKTNKMPPSMVLEDGNVVWLENIRLKNGKPLSVNMHGMNKDTFRIHFEDGLLSRFEFSKEASPGEKTVQILNFKQGKPKSYIKFGCPSEYSTKNVKWLKFYDLNDGTWNAIPPDKF